MLRVLVDSEHEICSREMLVWMEKTRQDKAKGNNNVLHV